MANQNINWKQLWLGGFVILVVAMISVGGVTRLTRSGLSIVEWRPVTGIIPPLTEQAWQRQFELYQNSPEYQQVNSHFGLEEYKSIFIWEYLHRVLGRLIFFFVVIPGFILWRKKIVEGNLVILFAGLVAAQGLVGWLMVKTGLNVRPHVSPYMLALHFFFALFLLILAYREYVKTKSPILVELKPNQKKWLNGLGMVLLLQIFYGCLVSGMKAGFAFNTYPLMGGEFFPAGGFSLDPAWLNIFENPATVQWIHRWLGIIVFLLMLYVSMSLLKTAKVSLRGPIYHLLGVTAVQIILGILNIVFVVPLKLAILHQLVATLLVMAFFNICFRVRTSG